MRPNTKSILVLMAFVTAGVIIALSKMAAMLPQ